ncbi:ABC transporter permease subunit [Parvibaculum sp.]|jgi:putrescine transport system permease protein|uniref:ABC transporter permease subunit n=1 Tax=Parvibaculum sp. TaxID=2024848 RepID=UPI000C98D9E5|nr:ABC transporter permease subunit [Parvibaculum sp.]MAB13013.1 putrescine ABC transporter permease PotI [Parvibaculum sp.]
MNKGNSLFIKTMMLLGFVFLYAPVLLLMLYSFNESKLVTVWAGFSTKWYAALLQDDQILNAAWLSLKIAAINSTIAIVIGTLAAITLVRFGKFLGRTMMTWMIAAPLVMPDVILGLSLLLLFVSMSAVIGFPEGRGMLTIIIAHVTFSSAYVSVIVQARLSSLDRSYEEAAIDLGAGPVTVFRTVTLPLIMPSVIAGWLLSFIMSFDDLVIASFVSGPSSSTLPMVIFSKVRLGLNPEINALATIVITLVSIGVAAAGIVLARQAAKANNPGGMGAAFAQAAD